MSSEANILSSDDDQFEDSRENIGDADLDLQLNETPENIAEAGLDVQLNENLEQVERNEEVEVDQPQNEPEADANLNSEDNFRYLRNRRIKLTVEPPKRQRRNRNNTMADPPPNAPDANIADNVDQEGAAAQPQSIFHGLSPNRIEKIKDMVSQQVVAALGSVKVTTINPKVKFPEYNSESMTADTYFVKCRDYFRSQSIPQDQYHEVISIMLEGDKKMWHDNIASTIKSWDDFCRHFRAKYDSDVIQEKRKRLLYNLEPQLDESVEQFVHEMVNLARQINPNEAEHISVDRAFEKLVPDLTCVMGDLNEKTVNNLVEKTATAALRIRQRDNKNNTYTRLPPIYGFKSKAEKEKGRQKKI